MLPPRLAARCSVGNVGSTIGPRQHYSVHSKQAYARSPGTAASAPAYRAAAMASPMALVDCGSRRRGPRCRRRRPPRSSWRRRVAKVVQQQRRGQDRRRGICLLLARNVRGRAVDRLEHGRRGAVHVDVAGCGQADAAGDGCGQVGDDVAEEVVGDDDVEACGVGDQEDHGRINVQVVDADVREFLRHGLDRALPQVAGIDQHVVLVDVGELLAGAGAGAAEARRGPRAPHRRPC